MQCDKCGQEVPSNNDASFIDAVVTGKPEMILFNGARHFLPVYDDNGNMICEGSPSRAQYIEGQPRDKRGYVYNKDRELPIRAAYERIKNTKDYEEIHDV